MRFSKIKPGARVLAACVAAAAGSAAQAQQGQIPPAAQTELRFAQMLNALGMPDYAELVMNDFAAKFPALAQEADRMTLETLLTQGKFDEAKKITDARAAREPDTARTWRMKILTGDYHFAYGQYPEANAAYGALFDKFGKTKQEDPAMAAFLAESAYKFAQMHLRLGDAKGAEEAMRMLIAMPGVDADARRQTMYDLAELLTRAAEKTPAGKERETKMAAAKKATEDLLWVQDLWFGRGVVLLAQIEYAKGNADAADKLITQYMPQLRNIHAQLAEIGPDALRLTPIAQCRFLAGVMAQDEADALAKTAAPDQNRIKSLLARALKEFVNVYGQYPSSSWAGEAMNRGDAIVTLLKDQYGVRGVNIPLTPLQRREIAEKQFDNARTLYNRSEFQAAADAYLIVLNQFPDAVPQSIDAYGELARAYAQIGDAAPDEKVFADLCAAAVAGNLAERFANAGAAGMLKAGDTLRALAAFYDGRGQPLEKDAVNTLFFSNYQGHHSAANTLMAAAEAAYRAEDYAGAAARYRTLMEEYQRSPVSYDAMRRLADCLNRLGDAAGERAVREEFVRRAAARENPGQDYITGMFMLERLNRAAATQLLKDSMLAFEEARRAGLSASAPGAAETNAMDSAMAGIAKANTDLFGAVRAYNEIAKILAGADRAKYESTQDEKARNDQILENALYESAFALTQMTQPPAQVPKFRAAAIQQYNNLLTRFPKSATAPGVLLQMGTLWATMQADDEAAKTENARKADEYFTRLANEHPESEQAKNAYFFRGRTLIEMDYRREGVEWLRKMFVESSRYSAAQLFQAAEYLLGAGDTALAREGYQLAIKGAVAMNDAEARAQITVPAEYGLADILAREKKYTEAADALDKFTTENPRSYKVVDAYRLIAKCASLAAADTAGQQARDALFARAVTAIRKLRQHLKSAKELAALELEVGKIIETQVGVAAKYDGEAKAAQELGRASSHYQQMVSTLDRSNADLLPILDAAFERSITLTLGMKKYSDGTPVYQDVADDCNDYIALFQNNGRHAPAVRAALMEAQANLN